MLKIAANSVVRDEWPRYEIEDILRKYDSRRLHLGDAFIDRIIGIRAAEVEKQLDIGELLVRYGNHRLAKGDFPYSVVRQLFRSLQPYLGKPDTLLDLGCGYGRIAFYGGLLKKGRIVGIEILEERALEAERVRRRLRLRNVQIVAGNVSACDWPTCSCICLLNSVAASVLPSIGRRIRELGKSRRLIVASHSNSNLFFERQSWMREIVNRRPSRWTFDLRLFETISD